MEVDVPPCGGVSDGAGEPAHRARGDNSGSRAPYATPDGTARHRRDGTRIGPATEFGDVRPPNGAPDHAVERPPAPTPVSIAEPPAAAAPQGDTAAAARVAAYFGRLDMISGGGLHDPSREAAQRLLEAALQGDTTALDGLIADTERAEREVQTIVAPPECAEYHRELLGSLADGRALVGELRATLASEDSNRLVQMSARASALQRRAEELHSRERDLRARHGVPSA